MRKAAPKPLSDRTGTELAEPGFMPMRFATAVEAPLIRVKAQRSNARIKFEWPLQAADAGGAWLR